MFNTAKAALTRIVREEKGAEGIEKILILAAVALPLLAVLLFFADEIRVWIADNYANVVGNGAENNNPNENPF